jgi:hypothetical protein
MSIGLIQPISNDNRRFKLESIESIKNFPPFANLQLNIETTFADAFGEDSVIFYEVHKYNLEKIVYVERGLGRLEGNYFVRDKVVSRGIDTAHFIPSENPTPKDIPQSSDELIVLLTYYPENYQGALLVPNSVITSSSNLVQLTTLPNNSLLGRLDGDIEAVTFHELQESAPFVDVVKKVLKAIGTVFAKALTLSPRKRPKRAQKGTLIYNKDTDCVEVYNGTEWRSI